MKQLFSAANSYFSARFLAVLLAFIIGLNGLAFYSSQRPARAQQPAVAPASAAFTATPPGSLFDFQQYDRLDQQRLAHDTVYQARPRPHSPVRYQLRRGATVFGWHPYWMDNAYVNYDFNLLTYVAFHGYEATRKGELTEPPRGDFDGLLRSAHRMNPHCKVLLSVAYRETEADTLLFSADSVATAARNQLVENVVDEVLAQNADGVNLNLDFALPAATWTPQTRQQLVQESKQLAKRQQAWQQKRDSLGPALAALNHAQVMVLLAQGSLDAARKYLNQRTEQLTTKTADLQKEMQRLSTELNRQAQEYVDLGLRKQPLTAKNQQLPSQKKKLERRKKWPAMVRLNYQKKLLRYRQDSTLLVAYGLQLQQHRQDVAAYRQQMAAYRQSLTDRGTLAGQRQAAQAALSRAALDSAYKEQEVEQLAASYARRKAAYKADSAVVAQDQVALDQLLTQAAADSATYAQQLPQRLQTQQARAGRLRSFVADLAMSLRQEDSSFVLTLSLPAVDAAGTYSHLQVLTKVVDLFVIKPHDYTAGQLPPGPIMPLKPTPQSGGHAVSTSVKYYLNQGVLPGQLLVTFAHLNKVWPQANQLPSRLLGAAGQDQAPFRYLTNSVFWTQNTLLAQPDSTTLGTLTDLRKMQAWVEDSATLGPKYYWITKQHLAGVGIWALGYDNSDDQTWNLLRERFGVPIAEPLLDQVLHVLLLSVAVLVAFFLFGLALALALRAYAIVPNPTLFATICVLIVLCVASLGLYLWFIDELDFSSTQLPWILAMAGLWLLVFIGFVYSRYWRQQVLP
ncbi:glycosyl hydrolase family 18 protein [Hymenobacter cellulosivorans]|uniref:chitinase n=1 Tax=Hymenobacter cellulosivorans TaxID=2932249 RepID=A0ABY4F5Y8_9BACT|nr:glycosyl hydrolase family 18 protein [Hymenobacter cellulosivorans]UOQ52087.1 glycosyl hydrolase family 18 protein [Hymenobacter cellulosivorans]